MTGAVLYDRVTSVQVNLHMVIQFKPDFTRNNVLEIYSVGRVHTRVRGLHMSPVTRQDSIHFG